MRLTNQWSIKAKAQAQEWKEAEHPMAPAFFSRHDCLLKRMKAVDLLERTIYAEKAAVAPEELGYALNIAGFKWTH